MTADTIAALAALVAAVGGIVAAVLAYRSKRAAEASKDATDANAARLMLVEGVVMTLGPALDGRLTELLKAEIGKARAEGVLQGGQDQRDIEAGR